MRSFETVRALLILFSSFVLLGISNAQPETRCSIQNQLSVLTSISNVPRTVPSKRVNVSSSREFTVSFWFKPGKLPKEETVSLFSIQNPNFRERLEMIGEEPVFKFYSHYPECPVSPARIKNHPSYANDPHIKNNPNCFPDKIKLGEFTKTVKPVDLIQKVLEVNFSDSNQGQLIFDVPSNFNTESSVVSYLAESLQGVKFDKEEWVFAVISLDYANNKGKAYVLNLKSPNNEHKIEFKLALPEFSIKRGFSITYGDTQGGQELYGYLYDLNLFYMYFEHPDLLRLFNYDEYTFMNDNIKVELLFDAKNTSYPLESYGEVKRKFKPKGEIELGAKGYVFKKNSFVEIGRVERQQGDKLVKSVAFYFTIKLKNEVNNRYTLLQAKEGKKVFMLSLVRDDLDNSLYYALEASIGDIKYKTPRFVEINELSMFTFSIVITDSKYLTFYFSNGRKLYDVSAVYKKDDFDLRNLDYTLFSDKGNRGEILINRFIILDDPLPSIIAVQNNVLMESCNRNCEIPLDPHSTAKSCLQCKNSVVLPVDNHCVEFCPPNTKNSNGVCVSCSESMCKEIFPASLTLSRLNNTAFIIELNKRINQFNSKKIDNLFEIQVEQLRRKIDYDYTMEVGSSTVVIVNFDFKRSFYNKVVTVQSNFTNFESVYDEDRNFIYSLNAEYTIPVFHYLSPTNELITKIFAYIIFAIFLITVAIGVLLFVLSFKYNLNEQVVKKFSLLFRDKQLLPLLLFLHIIYPSNLHNFLSILYSYIIGFNAVYTPFTDEAYLVKSTLPHPNIYDRQLTSLFVQNFGVTLIIHVLIIAAFILITISGICYGCFSIRLKELILKTKDSFEYNLLIVSFIVFDFQTFVFANLNFEQPVLDNTFTHASFYIAVAYISLFLMFIIMFTISFLKRSYFIPQSDLKFKLSFMFIGYRNRPLPNFYEIIILVMNFITASILVYLRSMPVPQISCFIGFMLFYLIVTLIIKPHEENKRGRLESFNRVMMSCVLIFIAALAISDVNKGYNEEYREIAGWVIIGLIMVYVIINFVIAFYHLVAFIIRIRKSIKIIFYDREDEMNEVNALRRGSSRFRESAFKEDEDFEEKKAMKGSLGKLGNLGDKMNGSYFVTGQKPNGITKNNNDSENRGKYYSFSNSSFEKDKSDIEESGKNRNKA